MKYIKKRGLSKCVHLLPNEIAANLRGHDVPHPVTRQQEKLVSRGARDHGNILDISGAKKKAGCFDLINSGLQETIELDLDKQKNIGINAYFANTRVFFFVFYVRKRPRGCKTWPFVHNIFFLQQQLK